MRNNGPVLLFFCFFWLVVSVELSAQIPVSRWRSHLSYDSIQAVTGSRDRIFAAAQSGILIYHKKYNSTETLDKVTGLSDAPISSLAYSSDHEALFIGYHNGNLDVLRDGKISNYPDLMNQHIYARKTISSICFKDGEALLSGPFGIAVFDPETGEFRVTFQPGSGEVLRVNDVDYDDKYFYAATELGIYYAEVQAPDLYDPAAWKQVISYSGYNREVEHLEVLGTYALFSVKNTAGKDELYYLDELNNATMLLNENVNALEMFDNELHVALRNSLQIYNRELALRESVAEYPFHLPYPTSVYRDVGDGTLWLGDARSGLVKYAGKTAESIVYEGPSSDHAFEIVSYGNEVFSVPGGYNSNLKPFNRPAAIYTFSAQEWSNELFGQVHDFVDILVDPNGNNHIFIGSWGDGLLEIRKGSIETHYLEANSTLEASAGQGIRIQDIEFDDHGNLWVLNHGTKDPVKFKAYEGNWKVFEYEVLENKNPGGLLSASNGYKWGFLHDKPEFFVIDEGGTPGNHEDDQVVLREPMDFNGNTFIKRIFDIKEDREGNIWFATDNGICVDFQPSMVFESEPYKPSRLQVTEEGYSHFMLQDNIITDMAVDPANQLWFATQSSGVFVYNANTQQIVHHFTSLNSPLINDTIQSLAITESGEVFISTRRGMISYRSRSSKGKTNFDEAYAFPNPVPPGYQNIITITNLVENVNVKITDINGNLVHETIASGGQATWDGKDFSGHGVGSGVYLIFMTNEDGTKTHVEKLLFIK